MQTKKPADYSGIGIAIETLIESTVSVTARHSDTAPIASVAAMALVSRVEATGAGGLTKPTVTGDRIMVQILQRAGRITRDASQYRTARRRHCGGGRAETAPSPQALTAGPRLLTFAGFLARM
jgi:hypothetical protein